VARFEEFYNERPKVIERTPQGDMEMDVFTRLLKDRIVWLGSPIDSYVSNIIMAQLLYLDHEDPDEDIYLYINSPGGSVTDGLGIYDTMQFVNPDVVTICAGGSYSMATVLLCAGAKGKRFALPNAIIHQHPVLNYGIGGSNPDVQIHAKHLLDLDTRLKNIIAHHTKQPLERVTRDFERDHYMNPEEAIEFGIIDQIITKMPNL
jgi:ATP-dependent Clp protease, protease subunit